MKRTKNKGPFLDSFITSRIRNKKIERKTSVGRHSEILPIFINETVYVHNGKEKKELNITEEMLGYKFGEFCFTRKKYIYKKRKKSKKKK